MAAFDSGWVATTFYGVSYSIRISGNADRVTGSQNVRFHGSVQTRQNGTQYNTDPHYVSVDNGILNNGQIKGSGSLGNGGIATRNFDTTLNRGTAAGSLTLTGTWTGGGNTRTASVTANYAASAIAPSIPTLGEVTNITTNSAQTTVSIPSWGVPASGYYLIDLINKGRTITGSTIKLLPEDTIQSLTMQGLTIQPGSGNPSPVNIRPLGGRPLITLSQDSLSSVNLHGRGGTVDVVDNDGVLTRRMFSYQCTGLENWSRETTNGSFFAIPRRSIPAVIPAGRNYAGTVIPNIICSHYKATTTNQANVQGVSGWYDDWCAFRIIDNNFSSVSDFKAYLLNQVAIGTPVTIVYELASPMVDATPPNITAGMSGCTVQHGAGDPSPTNIRPVAGSANLNVGLYGSAMGNTTNLVDEVSSSGTLTRRWAYYVFTGDENFTYENIGAGRYYITPTDMAAAGMVAIKPPVLDSEISSLVCTHLRTTPNSGAYQPETISVASSGTIRFSYNVFPNIAAFKSWVKGVAVLYEVATPIITTTLPVGIASGMSGYTRLLGSRSPSPNNPIVIEGRRNFIGNTTLCGQDGIYDEVDSNGNIARRFRLITLPGDNGWNKAFDGNYFFRTIVDVKNTGVSRLACSHLNPAGWAWENTPNNSITVRPGNNNQRWLQCRNDDFSTAGEFNTWLNAQIAAGTPVQVVYELDTAATETVALSYSNIPAGSTIVGSSEIAVRIGGGSTTEIRYPSSGTTSATSTQTVTLHNLAPRTDYTLSNLRALNGQTTLAATIRSFTTESLPPTPNHVTIIDKTGNVIESNVNVIAPDGSITPVVLNSITPT